MLNRRMLLKSAGAFACSAAAHPFLTTVTLAGSDGGQPLGDHRLVVIILRGAMDGLDVVQPRGDGAYAGLRPTLAQPDAADLDGFFALHSGLGGLMPLWQAGQLGFVHATSTPYRDKRSHFSGQDQLEAGTGMDLPASQVRDGWLNRMLQAVPGVRAETAFAVGNEEMKLLHGPAAVREWAPDTRLDLSPQAQLLLEHVYHDDPLFLAAASDAFALGGDPGPRRRAADLSVRVDAARCLERLGVSRPPAAAFGSGPRTRPFVKVDGTAPVGLRSTMPRSLFGADRL